MNLGLAYGVPIARQVIGYPNQPKCSITANCNSDILRVLVCQPWSYGLSPYFANTNTSFGYTLEGVAYIQDPEVDLYGS